MNSAAVLEKRHSATWSCVLRALNNGDRLILAFFRWFDAAYKESAFGRFMGKASGKARVLAASSYAVKAGTWFIHLAAAPKGKPITEATFLGFVLGLGVIMPTPVQLVLFSSYLFIVIWRRSTSEDVLLIRPPFSVLFPFLLLALFLFGATVTSVVPRKSALSLALWAFNGLAFLLAFDFCARGEGESLLWPFLSLVTFSGLVGLYQHFSGWMPPQSWLDTKFEDDIVRVVGTFKNPTFFAEMLGLALPVTLALLLKKSNWRDHFLLAGFAGIQGAAMLFTWSRGGWLGLLVSAALLALLFDRRLFLVGLLVAALAFSFGPSVLRNRLLSSFTLDDSSNNYRVFIWRGSISLIREYLFRGVGLGAESFVQTYPEHMIVQTPAPHAHCTFLQVLIELGLWGFLTLLWLLGTCVWLALSEIGKRKETGLLRWTRVAGCSGVLAVLGGHGVHGLVEHTWYDPQITVGFWAWAGAAAGLALYLRSERIHDETVIQ